MFIFGLRVAARVCLHLKRLDREAGRRNVMRIVSRRAGDRPSFLSSPPVPAWRLPPFCAKVPESYPSPFAHLP